MKKPYLIIINGLPGSGKTTLAKRLATDIKFPVFSRDGFYETLHDTLANQLAISAQLGSAAYILLYYVTGLVLEAGQSAIIEGYFGRPELRTAEFLDLQRRHDFEPFQILLVVDGTVLVERVIARAASEARHFGHQDDAWLRQNKAILLQGRIPALKLGGEMLELDTTHPEQLDYAQLLERVRAFIE